MSRAHFVVNVHDLDAEELVEFSRAVFDRFESVARRLPLKDYETALVVDEGSIKGWAKVSVVSGAVLYHGIAQFGDFVGGVREIAGLSREVATVVVRAAAEESTGSFRSIESFRRTGGVPARLERLFRDVDRGLLSPEEATRQAVEMLSREGQLPEDAAGIIEESIRGIDRYEQLSLIPEIGAIPPSAPEPQAPAPRRRPAPSEFLHVEMVRRSRDDDIEVRTDRRRR